MDVKVILCTSLIYSMLNGRIFACEVKRIDCYIDVDCPNDSNYPRNTNLFRVIDMCSNNIIYRDYYEYSPVRLTVAPNATSLLRILSTDYSDPRNIKTFIFHLIVELNISHAGLKITPDLYEMENLKVLNLSMNNLLSANLYNSVNLKALENLDLSGNSIKSIEVDESQYVYKNLRTLNLSHNFLTSIEGGIFDELKNLTYLDLSDNNINMIDHYSFEGLKSLRYLYLSHNIISDINVSLFRFSNLEELYLDNNNIESLLEKDFTNLRRLQLLDLDYNKIRCIEKDTFKDMDTLSTLKLSNNFLSFIHKDTFLPINNLKIIDLSNNLLENITNNLFQNKSITSFYVVGNNIKSPIFKGTFEGLLLVTELDLSYQEIREIDEFAFFGMEQLTTLLLNNNQIQIVANHSFNTLKHLKHLDLSNNYIIDLNFDKRDLLSLENFSLHKNNIKHILIDDFQGLNRLRYLDLSYNNISVLEPNAFRSLVALESLQIFHNPISGALLNNSFSGLNLVPTLDMSFTLVTSIKNRSFSDMVFLRDLNISRSSISELEYNSFMNTGNIQILDLSYNKLTQFNINGNDLQEIKQIFLNNNKLAHYCFENMSLLSKVILSYNFIQNTDDESFKDQMNLNYLDLSFNYNLTFHVPAINNARKLDVLIISGVKYGIDFVKTPVLPMKELKISHSSISNVSQLHLNSMEFLTNLDLSNNIITNLEINAFKNIGALKWLDLSFNNISFIQPGTFKDNVFLYNLNLSHNSLSSLNYGIFRGLSSLNILDVSFNSINDLRSERFYDTQNLKILIIDHNRVTDINENSFGENLSYLSIGDNPLPCEKIVMLKQRNLINIGSLHKNEISGENIDGVSCSLKSHASHSKTKMNVSNDKIHFDENVSILANIRDILLNFSTVKLGSISTPDRNNLTDSDLHNQIDKYQTDHTIDQNQLKNITSVMAEDVSKTNSILERILEVVLGLRRIQNKPLIVNASNVTTNKDNNETLVQSNPKLVSLESDVNHVKQDLLYLENEISDMNRKISMGTIFNTTSVLQDSYKSDPTGDINKSDVFLEVCISLILAILVCFILYKCYKKKLLIPSSRSVSTRRIADNLDNSTL